jgi:transcription elongation factor Elf1
MTTRAMLAFAPPSEGKRRSNRPFTFVSTCSMCGRERVQYAYTRRALVRLLEKVQVQVIYALCATCGVVWPINAQERRSIVDALGEPTQHPGNP